LRVLLNLRFFAHPYFDHDALLHHALHVLDDPGNNKFEIKMLPSISTFLGVDLAPSLGNGKNFADHILE